MLLSLAACGGKDDIPNEPADQTPPAAADNKQPDTAVPVDEMPVVRLCINKPGTGDVTTFLHIQMHAVAA